MFIKCFFKAKKTKSCFISNFQYLTEKTGSVVLVYSAHLKLCVVPIEITVAVCHVELPAWKSLAVRMWRGTI